MSLGCDNIVEAKSVFIKGTNTWLNSDVEKSKTKIVDAESRGELGNLSITFWQDQFFVENTKVETSFVEENKYRNYYEGYSHLLFPRYDQAYADEADNMLQSSYALYTSSTSGFLRSPWYGEAFDKDKFEYAASYTYNIYLPTNLSNISDLYSDLSFVLQFHLDVSLYPGNEYVKIDRLGKTGVTEWVEYYNEYYDVTVYEPEYFFQTGNASVVRKYKASKLSNKEVAKIKMVRVLDKAIVENSLEKRNTGFQLSWYFEDESGNRVEVEQDDKYAGEIENKRFVTFMNILYRAVTDNNVDLEILWDIAKKYRLEYIIRKARNEEAYCDHVSVTDTEDYFIYLSSALGIPLSLQDRPVYKEFLTDSFLADGFQLFYYMARCQDMDKGSIDIFRKYMNSFNLDSTTMMLEAAMVMNNFDTKLKTGRDIWKKSSLDKLMQKMDQVFGLNIYKLEILSSGADNLENMKDARMKMELKACVEKGHCEELRNIINDLGKSNLPLHCIFHGTAGS